MKMTEKVTKNEMMELLEENTFYSHLAMKKAGHVGLIVMAAYLVMRESMKGQENKNSKVLLLISMLFLVLDNVREVVHEVKKVICHLYRDQDADKVSINHCQQMKIR